MVHHAPIHRAILVGSLALTAACSKGADDGSSTDNTTRGDSGAGDPGAGGNSGGLGNPDGVDPLPPLPDDVALPIVFVHGFAGSAQQYQSQAMRFVANGYPEERIRAFDHDGAGLDIAAYVTGTDEVVDAVRAEFGVDQVYLVGHSRGTLVSNQYLGDAARVAKIAKYVSLDGGGCTVAEGAGVPCIAPSQALLPGQAHVEVATSKQSFEMQYEFLVGSPPAVVDVVPQRAPVELSGRAVAFPANTGRDGTTLEFWEIDGSTGERATSEPLATFDIGPDGSWGPVVVDSTKYYEKVLSSPAGTSQHFYAQRYPRSSRLVRLLSGPPDAPSRVNSNITEDHTNIIVLRMREWYATDDPDNAGNESDVLEIETSSPSGDRGAVNAIQSFVGNGAIALHIHDDAATPKESTLAALPYFSGQPFQNGVDVFMPAADPPDGVVSVTNLPRGDETRPQTLHFPNWSAAEHTVMVMFSDYAED